MPYYEYYCTDCNQVFEIFLTYQELGEDMGPEFDEVVDRLEKGQSPEDIENDLPDLGSGGDGLNPGLDL